MSNWKKPSTDYQTGSQPKMLKRTKIEILGLSTRAYNALRRGGVETVEQLSAMNDDDLQRIPYLGSNSFAEIREKLALYLTNHRSSELFDPPELPQDLPLLNRYHISPKEQANSPVARQVTKIETLDLSNRASEYLQSIGINSVEYLLDVVNQKSLKDISNTSSLILSEIGESLIDYLSKYPVPDQFHPISIMNLSRQAYNRLIRAGIYTVGCLTRISDSYLLGIPNIGGTLLDEIRQKLTLYLANHAISYEQSYFFYEASFDSQIVMQQDSSSTEESELSVESQSINPETESFSTTNLDLTSMITAWLNRLSDRQRKVICWRYGLDGESLTLEQIGDHFEVSRERIRQVQTKALKRLQNHWNKKSIRHLETIIESLFERNSGVLSESQLVTMLAKEIEVGDTNLNRALKLVLELKADVVWIKKCQVWVMKPLLEEVLLNELGSLQLHLVKLIEKHYIPVPIDKVISQFKETPYYKKWEDFFSDDFILACLRSHPGLTENESDEIGLEKWARTRLDEIILALREIGQPAHFTVIADQTNALLSPDQRTKAHNIHAQMQRFPDIFIRVGHGIYGLKEWGLHDDGNLANAAYRVLQEAGLPLHIDIITNKVLKTWHVSPTSVFMAIENDERFTRIGRGLYCLKEHIGGNTNKTPKANFGDLFGEKLARLQIELDRQQASSELDVKAEVDKIRKLGSDFFT